MLTESPFILFLVCVLGLLVGSFLNVVIYRLPLMLFTSWRRECNEFLEEDKESAPSSSQDETSEQFNIAFPRSHCPSCKKIVPAWCNIPVVSYILLRGKCLHCKTKISFRYPSIEIITAIATAFIIYSYGLETKAYLLVGFSWVLICL
jgi:leader peptidase (prepilin peptidase)/N-methyltransferase